MDRGLYVQQRCFCHRVPLAPSKCHHLARQACSAECDISVVARDLQVGTSCRNMPRVRVPLCLKRKVYCFGTVGLQDGLETLSIFRIRKQIHCCDLLSYVCLIQLLVNCLSGTP